MAMKKQDDTYVEPHGGAYLIDGNGKRVPDPDYAFKTVTDTPENSASAQEPTDKPTQDQPDFPVKPKKGD
jgi:hypothetical protein